MLECCGHVSYCCCRYFHHSNNAFTGPIPWYLGRLPHLAVLHLHNNQLSGPIPEELASLTHLQVLRVEHNRLNGTIPFIPVTNRSYWDGNDLQGRMPDEICAMNLFRLAVDCDQVECPCCTHCCSDDSDICWDVSANMTADDRDTLPLPTLPELEDESDDDDDDVNLGPSGGGKPPGGGGERGP